MERRFSVALAGLAFLVGGCSGGGGGNDFGIDSGVIDLSSSEASGGGLIGSACTSDLDCKSGTTPVCFKSHFNNKNGNVGTRGGYCSSKCTTDTDCAPNGTCTNFGAEGSFCIAKCMAATDCRSFYACFNFGCFPADNLNCDPTIGDGSCTYRNTRPGGCVRQALGTGMKGECQEQCEVGVSTCAPDAFGNARQCLIDDEKTALDGTSSGDKWLGPLCLFSASMPPPIADGLECQYTPTGGTAGHFFDVCVDGDECYLKGMAMAGKGFDAAGDNKCHKLCYLATPATPDAGLDFSDGGMLAAACGGVTTCRDVFGLAGTSNPAGLCL